MGGFSFESRDIGYCAWRGLTDNTKLMEVESCQMLPKCNLRVIL